MHRVSAAAWFAGTLCFTFTAPLVAQQPCPGASIVVNTPEDQLMLAINGAENPQDQLAALDKFVQQHADSKFMPCVNEYYTSTYVKLNNFDKAIEYGEKDVAANDVSLNLMLNLLKAYVGAGKASDTAFDIIMKAPDRIQTETKPARPEKATDEDWQKIQQEAAETAKDNRAYMEYAFFQLLPRVTDANKRIQFLDAFMKAFPDTSNMGQVNFQYFVAYKMANNAAKADEFGEKTIASDPNNIAALNLIADDYATRRTNLDKATDYAKKVLTLAPAVKKIDGMSDDQFKANVNAQLGMAHTTLGYISFLKGAGTHKVGPAIQEFKTAITLLNGNPELQGKALYFLGYAYEVLYPPNHSEATDALTQASALPSGFQAQARDLLAKVKKAK